jgi:hypothetical protein
VGGDGGNGAAGAVLSGLVGQSLDDAGGGGGGIGRIRVNTSGPAGLGGTLSPVATTGPLNAIAPPLTD